MIQVFEERLKCVVKDPLLTMILRGAIVDFRII